MRRRLKLILFVLLWWVLPVSADGHGDLYRFERVDVSDDLPQITINSILQDRRGFMWFTTSGGLLKYDGYRSRLFSYIPGNPNSLGGNHISTIYEDSRGFLWIGLMGGGLDRFDPISETFIHFKARQSLENPLLNNYILSICEDQKGYMWLGTHGGGLARLRLTAKGTASEEVEFTHYFHDPEDTNSVSNNVVYAIYTDRTGDIWVGTEDGLNRFDPETETFTRFHTNPRDPASIGSNLINCLYQDSSGRIWIGTADGGLNRLVTGEDPESPPTFIRYSEDPRNTSRWSGNYISTILEDSNKDLWIGTAGDGLKKFNRQTGEFQPFRHDPSNRHSLGNNEILSLCEDRNGNLWIGTAGVVHKLNPNSRHFISFRVDESKANNPSNYIFALLEDRAGNLWAGSMNGFLFKLVFETQPGSPHQVRRPTTGKTYKISDYQIRVIHQDDRGDLWVGTTPEGLFRVTSEGLTSGRCTNFRNVPTDPTGIGSDHIMAIHQDRLGNIWFGTRDGGISILTPENRESNTFIRYNMILEDPHSLSHPHVRAIYEDKKGIIWVGTYSGGLNRFDWSTNRFIHYRYSENDPTGLGSDCVMSILEDRAGNMWIGTGNAGLNKFDRESGTFKWYTKNDGLPDHMIYGMLEDDRGDLWLSTNKGLSRFDPKTEIFVNFSARDGLQDNEFNAGAFLENRTTGQLYFGGINGITTFHPRAIKMNSHIPPVRITSFNILNRDQGHDSIQDDSELILSYRDDMFSFEFVALDFTDPRKNKYAYMLEGFNDEWIHTDWMNRTATFTNIPPGNYRFRVKGSNNHGVWNEEGITVSVVITPPFWQTWWFRVLAILLLSLFILLLHKRRMQNLKIQLKTEHEIHRLFAKCNMTAREIEIIELLKKKKSYKEIEEELFISYHTVKNHIYNIFKKLGVENRAELIYYFKSIEDEMKRSDK